MGFFDDIFGGFFDFNGDGKTTWDEQWIAQKIIQDIENETKKENSDDTPIYYENWRLQVEDNRYGIDPYNYGTKEEYFNALEQAELADKEVAVDIPFTLKFSIEIPALDKIAAIKETDYPNERTYNAALRRNWLENDYKSKSLSDSDKHLYEQCDFILKKYNNLIAAHYLSSYFGEFLYAQAVKENFTLPFDLPDEDEKRLTPLIDLFIQIHKECKEHLLTIWKWLVNNFMPYIQYSSDNGYNLSTGIFLNCCNIDENFINEFADYISTNKAFGRAIIELSPSLDYKYGTLFALLLKKQQVKYTKDLFGICAKKDIDEAHIKGVIFGLMEACSNYKELGIEE